MATADSTIIKSVSVHHLGDGALSGMRIAEVVVAYVFRHAGRAVACPKINKTKR